MLVRDVELRAFSGGGPPESTESMIFVQKPPLMLKFIEEAISRTNPRRMVEIGVSQGGSAIYWENRFDLERLTLIDAAPAAPHLEQYIKRHRIDHVRPHFGVSQDNVSRLRAIIDSDFGVELIDVVIDDASHQYAETLASFECLFPRVKPGGIYIIEDWSWGHAASWNPEWWADRPLMSPLITEIMLACAYGDAIIFHVDVFGPYAIVERGTGKINEGFKLKDHYVRRNFVLP